MHARLNGHGAVPPPNGPDDPEPCQALSLPATATCEPPRGLGRAAESGDTPRQRSSSMSYSHRSLKYLRDVPLMHFAP